MCVGVPGKILSLTATDSPLPMAIIDMAGTTRQCCIAYTPEVTVGDWVLIQNGFAHSVLSEQDAAQALTAIAELRLLEQGNPAPQQPAAPPPTGINTALSERL
ncbi:HypC/HybG/HupF family hydrogenase formation chaperone [Corynebacterium choanae]|uniref:Hydrogenase isoenzymes formation protein HypC n=1 Tax=Corynebacterium choanae TaxID=1862358 RepID=A0A3G6J8D5_9CORY|nr:HypC/HybG/HupF family hydrogenase formation chaperone [Corynebacterium choanae]AZA14365.1 Hydrogenase isoenzymes formation protein HypC [Corynebacterium choanae]